MEKYGFIYLWYDKKHKKYYIGRHWGHVNDGYVCSSNNMRNNFKNRPSDFRRRIISFVYTNLDDLVAEEQRWLNMIKKEEAGVKYYNVSLSATTPSTRGYKHSEQTKEKIKIGNLNKKISDETRQKNREASIKQFSDPEQRKKISEKSRELWKDPEYRKINTENKISKKQSREQIEKRVQATKDRWSVEPRRGVPKTEEEKQRLKEVFKNMIWITDGKINKRVDKTSAIPEGFRKGRSK